MCELAWSSDEAYVAYHDEEWGVPVHDDKYVPMSSPTHQPRRACFITMEKGFFSSFWGGIEF
jgi:hypothetical protein